MRCVVCGRPPAEPCNERTHEVHDLLWTRTRYEDWPWHRWATAVLLGALLAFVIPAVIGVPL